MTLTSRLSGFVLALLGVVLIAFSASVWWFARLQLERELDDRVEPLLDALLTATEVRQGGVTWEPHEHSLANGGVWPTSDHSLVWLVVNERGDVLNQSSPAAATALRDVVVATADAPLSRSFVTRGGETWRVTRAQRPGPSPAAEPHRSDDPDDGADEIVHQSLVIVAGASWSPMATKLRMVGVVVSAVALLLWSLALIVSRGVCRRALAPVTTMASAAREMRAADLCERLPVAASRDELEDLGISFNGLLDRLQDSFERQRRFTGDASHQLRTPLTSMLGHVDVTLRRDRSPEEYRDTLNVVRRQTDHLSKIVEALLFLARADSEVAVPEPETVDLGEWLREFAASWQQHPRAADLQFAADLLERVVLRVATTFLAEILNTFLSNACQYSDPGTPVVLRVTEHGNNVRFDVTDHGHGISAADLPHLFQPFFRSESSRLRGIPGTGLGLSIAQRLATAIHAELSAVTTHHAGKISSTFSVLLPREDQSGSL